MSIKAFADHRYEPATAAKKTDEHHVFTKSKNPLSELAALRFICRKSELNNLVLIGLNQFLFDRTLVARVIRAHKAGARLAADINMKGKTLRQIVSDAAFAWASTSNATVAIAPVGSIRGTHVTLTRTVRGVTIIASCGHDKALDQCAAIIDQLIGKNQYAQKQFSTEKIALVIIPRDKKMTDMPQFKALAGTKTFDGRLWDNVRGSGGMRTPDGSWAIGVAEENIEHIKSDKYGAGYSVGMHEIAHTLESKGMTPAQQAKVTQMYDARKNEGGPWTEPYGASNVHEYFAHATNCYFGKNLGIGRNGKAWLKTHDAEMFRFLTELYETRHDEAGHAQN